MSLAQNVYSDRKEKNKQTNHVFFKESCTSYLILHGHPPKQKILNFRTGPTKAQPERHKAALFVPSCLAMVGKIKWMITDFFFFFLQCVCPCARAQIKFISTSHCICEKKCTFGEEKQQQPYMEMKLPMRVFSGWQKGQMNACSVGQIASPDHHWTLVTSIKRECKISVGDSARCDQLCDACVCLILTY